MTTLQLKINRGVWRAREVFRYRRWGYWRSEKGRKRAGGGWKALRAKWWGLYVQARDKRAWYDKQIAKRAPATPSGEGLTRIARPWNPKLKPIPNWIIPILDWAWAHGWRGYVVSGWRSHAEQWAAAVAYGLWHYANNNPFFSNHLRYIWPGGAVDVTDAPQLHAILRNYPGKRKLLWGLATMGFDEPHFSANGH